MSKRQGSKYKINRRLGVKLWGRPKSPINRREYGPGQLRVKTGCPLFDGLGEVVDIWNSHGDKVTKLPKGFRAVGTTDKASFGTTTRGFFEDKPNDIATTGFVPLRGDFAS